MQWGSLNITNLIESPDIIRTYGNLNESLVFEFELGVHGSLVRLPSFEITSRLLNMRPDGTQVYQTKSILNFENAKYLSQNLDNLPKIQERFDLSETHAILLRDYYNRILNTINRLSNELPALDYFRGTK